MEAANLDNNEEAKDSQTTSPAATLQASIKNESDIGTVVKNKSDVGINDEEKEESPPRARPEEESLPEPTQVASPAPPEPTQVATPVPPSFEINDEFNRLEISGSDSDATAGADKDVPRRDGVPTRRAGSPPSCNGLSNGAEAEAGGGNMGLTHLSSLFSPITKAEATTSRAGAETDAEAGGSSIGLTHLFSPITRAGAPARSAGSPPSRNGLNDGIEADADAEAGDGIHERQAMYLDRPRNA